MYLMLDMRATGGLSGEEFANQLLDHERIASCRAKALERRRRGGTSVWR